MAANLHVRIYSIAKSKKQQQQKKARKTQNKKTQKKQGHMVIT